MPCRAILPTTPAWRVRCTVLSTCVLLRVVPPGTPIQPKPPSLWLEHRTAVLLGVAMIALLLGLIGALLYERRRRHRTQAVIVEQLAYERAMAEVAEALVRRPADDRPGPFAHALGCLARYAAADVAVLVEDDAYAGARRFSWPAIVAGSTPEEEDRVRVAIRRARLLSASRTESREPVTETPTDGTEADWFGCRFVAGDVAAALVLHAGKDGRNRGWPDLLRQRVRAMAEVFASTIVRDRALQEMHRSETLSTAVLDSVSALVAVLDRRGVIVRVNAAWRTYAERHGVPRRLDAFVGCDYVEECRKAGARGVVEAAAIGEGIAGLLAGRTRAFRTEYQAGLTHGRWYELSVERLDRPEGGAIVSHVDITDRRLTQLHAEERQRQNEHMNRAATVAELAGSIAHELGQPLTSIRANAQVGRRMLAQGAKRMAELKEILGDIEADITRAGDIVARVRSMLRKEQPEMHLVSLNEVCADVARFLQPGAQLRGIDILLDVSLPAPRVLGDRVQIQQVVVNLVMNALDAIQSQHGPGTVRLCTRSTVEGVTLSVLDSGPGLPADDDTLLFEPFFTTKEDGLGMGLSIVRSIVRAHGASLRAENLASGGASFHVSFPADGAVTAPDQPASHSTYTGRKRPSLSVAQSAHG